MIVIEQQNRLTVVTSFIFIMTNFTLRVLFCFVEFSSVANLVIKWRCSKQLLLKFVRICILQDIFYDWKQ